MSEELTLRIIEVALEDYGMTAIDSCDWDRENGVFRFVGQHLNIDKQIIPIVVKYSSQMDAYSMC